MSKYRPTGDENLEPIERLHNRRVSIVEPDILKKIIDESVAGTTYVGFAQCGTPTSEAGWQISRITIAASITTVEWADGDGKFDNVWDDRASLEYI